MKTNAIRITILTTFLLAACAPATPLPATSAPATPTLVATVTPSIPTIEVEGLEIPDPKVTNPALFNLNSPRSPIVQFANAFGLAPADVAEGLSATLGSGEDGAPTALLLTSDAAPTSFDEAGIPLLIAEQDANGTWRWEKATLGNTAAQWGMTFGALFNLSAVFQPITAGNFTSGTAFIGWEYVHPARGTYTFDEYDHDFGFGADHGLKLTGAPLVWGYQTPDWVHNEPDMQALMVEHITRLMQRYQSVDRWVVYGEANHRGRDIFWNQPGPHGGMQAVRDAFATARRADADAVLIYNDYDTYDGFAWEDRMPTFEAVVSQIRADGNLDGIGLQVTGRMNTFSVDRLASTLGILGQYGLPVYVTELSIMIDGPNSPENLLRQAQVAEETVYVLRQSGVVEDITAWGLEDSLTNAMYFSNANAGLWLETAQGMFTPKPLVFTMMRALVK